MAFPQRFNASSSSSPFSDSRPATPDEAIRSTDSDASLSRLSAVQLGYLSDPFAESLIRGRPPLASYRRPPLINIGTHARTLGMDALVRRFLKGPGKTGGQIVGLGAGSDTRFWRLMADDSLRGSIRRYVEFDFPEITAQKAMQIKKSRALFETLGPAEGVKIGKSGTLLHSPIYSLIPHDLRDPFPEDLIDPTLPTLWIAECLLIYLEPTISERVVNWFSSHCRDWVGGICYEMYDLEDNFGKVLVSNLKSRQIALPSAHLYPTLSSQATRFSTHGYTSNSGALDINQIRALVLQAEERARTSKLEMLDEVEEMELLFGHYGISWGCRDPGIEDGETSPWGLP